MKTFSIQRFCPIFASTRAADEPESAENPAAANASAERPRKEREKDRRENDDPFDRRGGRSRKRESGNNFWLVLFAVFSLIFLWNSLYKPPRYEIPIGKLIELIEQGPASEKANDGETSISENSAKTGDSKSVAKSENSEKTERNAVPFPSIIVEEGKGKTWKKVRYSDLANVCVAAHEITGTATREVLDAATDKFPKKPRPDVEFFAGRQGLDVDASYFLELLKKSGFSDVRAQGTPSFFQHYGASLLTTALLIFVFIFLMRRMGAGAIAFGRSRASLVAQEDVDVSFADVAGVDEALDELKEIVEFLRTPEKFQALGGRIPKGVLLVGPPGTGKTLLAKAVAGEANAPFFSLSGSDFVELYAGVGAARVRDLFQQAERSAPCIVFIDELDALGKSRSGTGFGGGSDEREQTLNALLVEMDGFDANSGTIVMAATNRPEILDSALLRSGRFDRQVLVDRPDADGREAILKIHSKKVKLDENLDLREIATLTTGFVGADLSTLVNEAALLAARRDKQSVGIEEFTEAVERVSTGLEKKGRVVSPEEKIRIAYHECGHALVALSLPNADAVHKVSIVPRGMAALGYTLQRPEEDRYLSTRTELEDRAAILLAGTIAEELVFGDVSSGAQNDLERATEIARAMTTTLGMSRLGRVAYRTETTSFLDGGRFSSREHSEKTAWQIDEEIRSIIEKAGDRAREILERQKLILVKMATRLLERETLGADELRKILDGGRDRVASPGPAA